MGISDQSRNNIHICLLLSCFAVAPDRLPEMGVGRPARDVLAWTLSKRRTRRDFMGADEDYFLLVCRRYLRVRVLVYTLSRRSGSRSAELSFDTHPQDPALAGDDDSWWGEQPAPEPLACRTVVFVDRGCQTFCAFCTEHFMRVASEQEDRDVANALRSFSERFKGRSTDDLTRSLDKDLRRMWSMRAGGVGLPSPTAGQARAHTGAHTGARAARPGESDRAARKRQEEADAAMAMAVEIAEKKEQEELTASRRAREEADRAIAHALAAEFAQKEEDAIASACAPSLTTQTNPDQDALSWARVAVT